MTRADGRKHTFNLFWDTDGPELVIHPRPIWADGEVDVNQAAQWIDGNVPADGWRDLDADFLKRIKK